MGAMNMQMLARSLLIYRLTDSATILGIMSLAHAIPMLALSLYGGLIADRVQKKYVMLVGQAASAAVSLMVAVLLSSGYFSVENTGSWWILVFNSLLQGTIMALVMPSRQAVLPEIVGGEQLMNAVSLSNMGMNVLRLVAPALTGFLIDAFDFAAVFYTMTVLYLMAVLFISFLPRTSTITAQSSNAWTGIKEGIKYIKNETTILFILVFILFVVLLSMPYQTLMPIFTEDILEVGATGMGVLMSVSGIGAMFGSIVLASLPNKKRGLLLLLSSIFLSLALVGFSFSTSWHLSLVLVAFVGLGQTGRMTLGNTLLQYYVDNDYRGRVMSIYLMEFGITSLGTFAASILAEVIGPEWSVGGFALVLVCLSILALIFVPRLRRLD
jgi:MFS family permease